jgi:hypothetical protein
MTQLLSADLSSPVDTLCTGSVVEHAALDELRQLRSLDDRLGALKRAAMAIRSADEQRALLAALDVANGPAAALPQRRRGASPIRD